MLYLFEKWQDIHTSVHPNFHMSRRHKPFLIIENNCDLYYNFLSDFDFSFLAAVARIGKYREH